MKTIIQNRKECYMCRRAYGECNTRDLEDHHIFFGTANRRKSEEHGLKVWLCNYHHTSGDVAVHRWKTADDILKEIGQKKFEETHTRKEFMDIFGKNYLED